MLSSIKYKYKFEDVDSRKLCKYKLDSEIIPKLIRYTGLDTHQVICQLKNNPTQYFLVKIGGSNKSEIKTRTKYIRQLTPYDSISYRELVNKLNNVKIFTITQ
jgi:hypothetical protein